MSEQVEGTVVDATPAAPQVQTPEAPATDSLKELMDGDFSKYPEFNGENHKGITPLSELLDELPTDARAQVANLRKMVTKKTQEFSENKKQLAEDLRAREERIHELEKRLSLIEQVNFDEKLKEINDSAPVIDDIYDVEQQKALAKHEAEKTAMEALKNTFGSLQAKYEQDARNAVVNSFKEQHPEIKSDTELRLDMHEAMQADESLTLQRAYYLVKGKRAAQKEIETRMEYEKSKVEQASSLKKTSIGSATRAGGVPEFGNAKEYVAWLMAKEKSKE